MVPGLLPLTPLMNPPTGVNPNRWLEKCVDATFTARIDSENRQLLLGALGIFCGLVYDAQLIRHILPEGIMQENPFIQEILKEAREDAMASGIERGQKKCAIDLILDMLNGQFPENEVHELKPALEEIDELDRLKQLHRSVSKVRSYEKFKQILEN